MKRARIERGAGDVPGEPEDKDDEQVAVRHADASGGYITENQHEGKIQRDIQVYERGSGATSEEHLDEWRKTERLERETPNTSASSDPYVTLEHPVKRKTTSRPGPYMCRIQVVLTMTNTFLRWMYSTRRMNARIDASVKCRSGIEEKMPDISREVNYRYWLRIGHVSTITGRNFGKLIRIF